VERERVATGVGNLSILARIQSGNSVVWFKSRKSEIHANSSMSYQL